MKHIIEGNQHAKTPEAKLLLVDEECAGQRLDNFLMRHLKGVPKTHVYRIIRSGEVRVNKGRANADTRIADGDVVRLPPVRVSERMIDKAQSMQDGIKTGVKPKSFPILFEDEYLLIINKPAGVAVHGGSGVSFGVIEQLRMARPDDRFLELVHRLDRETSGVLMLAKKRSALKNLQDQFRERETGKTYLALVLGNWPGHKKVLDKPLHKYLLDGTSGGSHLGERRVKVVASDHPDGMRSVTLVKVRSRSDAKDFSLLEVTIKTGRTHQIRVHLSSEGLPIAGDDKYGDFVRNKTLAQAEAEPRLQRMFLHAWRLQFNHPMSGERCEILSELPTELEKFLAHAIPTPKSPQSQI